MKRILLYTTVVLLTIIALSSCNDTEIKGIPEKPAETTDTPNNYKSILTIEDGVLTKVPQSVFGFGKDRYEAVEKFEIEHGGKLKGEHNENSTITPGDGNKPIRIYTTTYDYETEDPLGYNPKRNYTIDNYKQVLIKSQILIKTSLIKQADGNFHALFMKALSNDGYNAIDSQTYQNDKYSLKIEDKGNYQLLSFQGIAVR